jgi:endonuclease/exonuclease/phosphatase family metal-dependent hydrolase
MRSGHAVKLISPQFVNRMEAIGLTYRGPSHPRGRRAEPWPKELPKDSNCVPTYHSTHQTPASATRQLDHVFASNGMDIEVAAINSVEKWGPSDHCCIEILV